MDADTGSSNSGANSGAAADSPSAGGLSGALDSASNFLHDHGPYAWLNSDQQETAQKVVGGLIDGNRPAAPAPTLAAPPAVQKPDFTAPASTGIPAPNAPSASAPAPKPAPSNDQLGYAALACGYTAKDAPRQIDNFGLAQHFGLSPNIIAARPDDFYRRWVIKDSRAALEGCTALPHMIVQQPHIASQLSPDIWSLKTAENLFSDAGHILKEIAGGIFEPGLHMATGIGAKIISDVFGVTATAYDALNGTEDAGRAERFREDIRNSMTYEPRTEAGASVYNPQNLIPAWFGKLLDLTLPQAPVDSSTAGGMFTNGIREGIPQLLNIAGAKFIPLVPKAIRGEPLPVDRPATPATPAPHVEQLPAKRPSPDAPAPHVEQLPAKRPSPDAPAPRAEPLPAKRPTEPPPEQPIAEEPAAPEPGLEAPDSKAPGTEAPGTEKPTAPKPENGEAPATQPGTPKDPGTPEASTPEEASAPEPQALPPETARQAVLDFARTAQLAKILQGTRLCQTNPALCSRVVREMAAQGDMHTLYVPKDAFEHMAQGRGTTSDALLAQMPETQANGGLLAIPAHEYFTALPEGMASDLSTLAKTLPARSSLAEAVEQARKPESKTPDATENGKPAKPPRWADTHPPLPPEQVKVPGGGLRAHENTGNPDGPRGHTLERHVGKTEQELLDRYKKQPYLKASSSFYNEAVAEDAIAAALKANDADIKTWLKSAKAQDKLEITTELPHDIGITIPKGKTNAFPARKVTVILKANPHVPGGYFILTGFPTL